MVLGIISAKHNPLHGIFVQTRYILQAFRGQKFSSHGSGAGKVGICQLELLDPFSPRPRQASHATSVAVISQSLLETTWRSLEGGMDEPEMAGLAQAVMAATNAAAQAAQAAAASGGAGVSAGSGTGEGILKRDLAKLIPRPGTFNPTDREQEVLQWRDWYWTVKQYLVVVDSAFQDELEKLELNPSTEVDWELLDEEEQQRSRFLYSLLGSLV